MQTKFVFGNIIHLKTRLYKHNFRSFNSRKLEIHTNFQTIGVSDESILYFKFDNKQCPICSPQKSFSRSKPKKLYVEESISHRICTKSFRSFNLFSRKQIITHLHLSLTPVAVKLIYKKQLKTFYLCKENNNNWIHEDTQRRIKFSEQSRQDYWSRRLENNENVFWLSAGLQNMKIPKQEVLI